VPGVFGGHSTPRPLGARRNRPLDVPDPMVARGPEDPNLVPGALDWPDQRVIR